MSHSKINNLTRIKICGIRSPAEALWARNCGADALGLNFYEQSPRFISVQDIHDITSAVAGFVATVALFVDPARSVVEEVIASRQISHLQFHGDESAEFCQSFQMPYLKALKIPQGQANLRLQAESVVTSAEHFESAAMILLDTSVADTPGGSGKRFDWEIVSYLPENLRRKIVLAGGLNAGNVQDAIRIAKPYAVDVSSGVELEKGQKCPEKVAEFCAAVRAA